MPEQAEAILDNHQKHDYAKRRHAEFALMWAILYRLGGARPLGLENYGTDEEGNRYVEFKHDPEQDTPLKNGENDVEGEDSDRQVNLTDWVCEILDDYTENERIDVKNDGHA